MRWQTPRCAAFRCNVVIWSVGLFWYIRRDQILTYRNVYKYICTCTSVSNRDSCCYEDSIGSPIFTILAARTCTCMFSYQNDQWDPQWMYRVEWVSFDFSVSKLANNERNNLYQSSQFLKLHEQLRLVKRERERGRFNLTTYNYNNAYSDCLQSVL